MLIFVFEPYPLLSDHFLFLFGLLLRASNGFYCRAITCRRLKIWRHVRLWLTAHTPCRRISQEMEVWSTATTVVSKWCDIVEAIVLFLIAPRMISGWLALLLCREVGALGKQRCKWFFYHQYSCPIVAFLLRPKTELRSMDSWTAWIVLRWGRSHVKFIGSSYLFESCRKDAVGNRRLRFSRKDIRSKAQMCCTEWFEILIGRQTDMIYTTLLCLHLQPYVSSPFWWVDWELCRILVLPPPDILAYY